MMLLSGPERKPAAGGHAKKLVFFLHGLGADGNDLIDLATNLAEVLPDTHFYSPNAPFSCDMAPFGYQWFSLQDRDESNMIAGIRHAAPILNHYIDHLLAMHHLTDKDVAYVGFSQGTMMALYVALRRPEACAAILGFSGALIAPALLANELTCRPKVLLSHGDQDQVVPFAAMSSAARSLESLHIDVTTYVAKGLGHGIDQQGIKLGKNFLKNAFEA